jgi:hypothetical protein
MEKIGIDIVGVIMKRSPLSDLLRIYNGDIPLQLCKGIPETYGIVKAVNGIVNRFRQENVFIVSSADGLLRNTILYWLEKNNILKRTGACTKNLIFCKERKEKAIVCAQRGITQFIDDRREVLHHIHESDPSIKLILFNPDEKEGCEFRTHQKHFTILADPGRIFGVIMDNIQFKRA